MTSVYDMLGIFIGYPSTDLGVVLLYFCACVIGTTVILSGIDIVMLISQTMNGRR